MKIWHLEKEKNNLLAFVCAIREKRRKNIGRSVRAIKNTLLAEKEKALIGFARKWDGWGKDYPLKLTKQEIEKAEQLVSAKDINVLKGMIRNVTLYHRTQKPVRHTYHRNGITVIDERAPVERILVYVPGGKAAYPSSLIMGIVPAQIAGVKHINVTTPASNGKVDPYICACCLLLGVDNLYRIGGAQAIYAFSYGIGNIPKVDMIVGPGNAFVEEAKRDVYGRVGIDMLAGPTELVILCDKAFSPEALSWDIFSQAEHDEMAMVGFFSSSKEHIYDVLKHIEKLISFNKRRDVVEKALRQNSFMVHYTDTASAIETINTIAPEHLEYIGDRANEKELKYPGIIYTGSYTTVAMGDYYIGTNHILPTGGAGRFIGGLSVETFLRRKTLVRVDKGFLNKYCDRAIRLSHIEGLFAHGEAIKARKEL